MSSLAILLLQLAILAAIIGGVGYVVYLVIRALKARDRNADVVELYGAGTETTKPVAHGLAAWSHPDDLPVRPVQMSCLTGNYL
jgi:hypothetical protein